MLLRTADKQNVRLPIMLLEKEQIRTEAARHHREVFAVQADDIDELDHVNNSVFLRYADRAAIAHAARVGLDFATMRGLGVVPVVHGHTIKYNKSALLGQTLEDYTWIESCQGIRSVRRHEIRCLEENTLLVEIKTDWVWVDPITQRPKRVAPEILVAFGL